MAAVPGAAVAAALGFARPEPFAPLLGALGLAVAFASAPYAWRLLAPVAVRFLGPSAAMAPEGRGAELTVHRADATATQAAEVRRVERDLHDGAQARLVGVGLCVATARKLMESDPDPDPDRARAAMRDAQEQAAALLAELRTLVRGINRRC